MKNQPPNLKQWHWRERVREMGSIITGARPAVIHHCAGRTAVHNKIHVGHWWILPLTDSEHAMIHAAPDRKGAEKELFRLVCMRHKRYEPLPFGEDVYEAILDYHR